MSVVLHRGGRPGGFTLAELLSAVAIIAILVAIAAPNFSSLLQNQRITTAANDLFASISLARSEAIRSGARVDLVPKDGTREWANGWVVFIDENGNQRPDRGERVIFSHDAVPGGISITANLSDSTVQYLAYVSTGRTRTNASSQVTQFGTFTFRLDKHVRKVKLNFLGRPRICNPDVDGASC